jgi:photosynthetic reaction center H subunit
MGTGAITQYVDVAQLVLYAFWIFFFGLVFYLVRENHREGYPMETENGRGVVTGWPIPEPKTFKLAHGGEAVVPNLTPSPQTLRAEPAHAWTGAPLVPTGNNPMLDGVGPGAWADRADVPDLDFEGQIKILPLRVATDFRISVKDNDPRGLPVVGGDGEVAGTAAKCRPGDPARGRKDHGLLRCRPALCHALAPGPADLTRTAQERA